MKTIHNFNKTIPITNKILDNFTLRNYQYLVDSTYYSDKSGIQEYRLYSYLTTFFNEITILDIGTLTGRSAVALSHNENNRVISYNLVDNIQFPNHPIYSKTNIEFRIKDVMEDLTSEFIQSNNVQIIMIDIDHYGDAEKRMIERLRDIGYSGIIILDDTHHPDKEMKECMEKLWTELDSIENLVKYDFTTYGHCSGTGVLLMNTNHIHFRFLDNEDEGEEAGVVKEEKTDLIFLIISSGNDPCYNKMKEINQSNYGRFKDKIKYFFVEYNETIKKDVVVSGHDLFIRGKESFIPGIYDKTIKAIEYITNTYNYKYLIRTNLSSFWNIQNALQLTTDLPTTRFAGGFTRLGFLSGTCMIFSKDVSKIVYSRYIPNTNVIDDVTISHVIQSNGIPLYDITQYKWGFLTPPPIESLPNWRVLSVEDEDISDVLFFRSKSTGDRWTDVENFYFLYDRLGPNSGI
jgi:hypothetical protein